MKLNTIISVYNADSRPNNPLIRVYTVTTDDDKATAIFQSMVARAIADGWRNVANHGTQIDLEKDGDTMTLCNHFTTAPFEMTAGRGEW